MSDDAKKSPGARSMEIDLGKQVLQAIFVIVVLAMMGLSLWPTVWVYDHFLPQVSARWQWVLLVLACILVFNYAYLVLLLFLRVIVPKPKEGFFPQTPGGRPSREVLLLMLNVLLTKLRFTPPWNQLLAAHLVRLPPLAGLYRSLFGPHMKTMTLGDTNHIIDPYLMYAGRNVQFGYDVGVTCHAFDNRGMRIKRVVVDDYAVIGGGSWLLPGVHVGHHAVVASCSMVKPDTEIPPYELWGGVPAKKIRDLPREE